jgi:NTP pyrophosphatase (non-canonical NTP hydrolase)
MDINLNKYKDFVEEVTSEPSNDTETLCERLNKLEDETNVNMALLLTSAIGLSSEGGEFAEIIKKCIFQGKPLDSDTRFHLKRELGDIMWYWVNGVRALGFDPDSVIAENVKKLESRYPGGSFNVFYSENRQAGDL